MLGLLLALSLMAPPAAPNGGPPPDEAARLYFVAGDLARAVQWAQQAQKIDAKRFRPLLVALADYEQLASNADGLTPAEARRFLELDRQISPRARGKLSEEVVARLVTRPLQLAYDALAHGDAARARRLAAHVLEVDPGNVDAIAFANADAGQAFAPFDGGL